MASQILGVDDDATQTDIKSAYRALAMTCHPDVAGEQGHNICILLKCAARHITTGSMPHIDVKQRLDSVLCCVLALCHYRHSLHLDKAVPPSAPSSRHALTCSEAYSALGTPAAREKYNLQLEQALQDEDDDFTGDF